MNHQDKLDRAKALLAKAEDPAATPAEAESYSARAMELLSKYGIDRALLHAGDRDSDAVDTRGYWMKNPYAMDKITLMNAIAKVLRCQALYIPSRGKGGKQMYVTGFASDLDRMEMLFNSLLVQQRRALASAPGPLPGESTTSYRKSFFAGFTNEVTRRLMDMERSARKDDRSTGTGTDLVLADRKQEVEREFNRRWGITSKTGRKLSGSGGSAGRSAGSRADLGGGRVGGSRRSISAYSA